MKIYSIYRNNREVSENLRMMCDEDDISEVWMLFIKRHITNGGRVSNVDKFIEESKQLGYVVRQIEE